ncbi:hypothetical protein EJV47_21015 [Hymenobacter gummosus]|uniref:Uncharacterized protein n=1 Tax=Hymenobacter gummosus TaxID=1776032 RepID=A0A3S0H2J7_9BACT|nr:hypothetical protein [Hymenobacter gummosus]RTQ46854.1 hypothetical protein EJV47_21015 [Hymenobacter gummosus]
MPTQPRPRRALDLISPRAHAITDIICFPIMLGLAAWAARRSKRAAAIILANTLGEGFMMSITRFEAGLFPLVSFRTHARVGQVGGPLWLALGALTPRVPQPERTVLIILGLLPTVLNHLSDTSAQDEPAA